MSASINYQMSQQRGVERKRLQLGETSPVFTALRCLCSRFFLWTNGALNTLVCVFTCGLEAARVLISIPKKSLTFRKRGHKYSLACGQNSSTRIGGGGGPRSAFPCAVTIARGPGRRQKLGTGWIHFYGLAPGQFSLFFTGCWLNRPSQHAIY